MSIQIIGMEMPKEPDEMIEIAIFGDGKVIQTGESWRNLESGKCYYTPTTPEKFFNAVPVPPHGRLIDADKIPYKKIMLDYDGEFYYGVTQPYIDRMPTIIPAEEGE